MNKSTYKTLNFCLTKSTTSVIAEYQAALARKMGNKNEAFHMDEMALKYYQQAYNALYRYYIGYPTYNHSAEDVKRNFHSLKNTPDRLFAMARWTEDGSRTQKLIASKIWRLMKYLKSSPPPFKEFQASSPPSNLPVIPHEEYITRYGEIIILAQIGSVPRKQERRIEFGLFPPHALLIRSQGLNVPVRPVVVKVPEYPPSIASPIKPTISISGTSDERRAVYISEQQSHSDYSALLADYADIAVNTFNEESGAIAAKAAFRASAKFATAYIAGRVAQKESDSWAVGALTEFSLGLLLEATEQADTRSWTMLPRQMILYRFPLPPGTYDVVISFHNAPPITHQRIRVEADDKHFYLTRRH